MKIIWRKIISQPHFPLFLPLGLHPYFASPSPAWEMGPAALAPCSSLAALDVSEQNCCKSTQMKLGRPRLLAAILLLMKASGLFHREGRSESRASAFSSLLLNCS